MKPAIALTIAALVLAGCKHTPTPEGPRVIAVPSSKPYRYIKPSPEDDLTTGTLRQIERHNETHWKVKQAEKRAQQETEN